MVPKTNSFNPRALNKIFKTFPTDVNFKLFGFCDHTSDVIQLESLTWSSVSENNSICIPMCRTSITIGITRLHVLQQVFV